MRSFLEPKPKFGITPFFKLDYFVPVFLRYTNMNLRLPLKIAVPLKIADGVLDLVSYLHYLFSRICHKGGS